LALRIEDRKYAELVLFARVLCDLEMFATIDDLLYFLEKPWKWDEEHDFWNEAGRPTYDEGENWQIFYEEFRGTFTP
jgi:hypothetical protein